MRPMSTAVTDERIKLFVGRVRECDALSAWLTNPDAPTRIIALTGMGGIGKSTLLIRLLQLAQEQEAVAAWVDARTCYRTPRGFEEALPDSYRQWLTQTSPRPKLVIGIDNFEELQVLEGWLREVFMGSLPDRNVLLLVASRTDVMQVWHTDPVWRPFIEVWPLSGFSNVEVDEFLTRRSISDATQIRNVLGPAANHPLAVALVSDAMDSYHGGDLSQIQNLVAETLSGRFIREIANEELHPLIDILTLLAESNQDLLQRVLQHRVPVGHYRKLMELSFVRRTRLGIGLHDMAQTALFRDFRTRDPGGLAELRRRIAQVLLSDLKAATPEQRGPIVQQLLWICRDIFSPPRTYVDLVGAPSELISTGFQPQDAPRLRQFITEWRRQSFPLANEQRLHLLDELMANFSGVIRVVRDTSGVPQAMFCNVPLYNKTIAMMEGYHPVVVKKLLAEDFGVTRCPVEESVASYVVLVGVNGHHPRYTPQELFGVMVLDQFALNAGLISMLLVTGDDLKEFVRSLGFVSQPFSISDPHEELFMIDMRHKHFSVWLTNLLGIGSTSSTIAVTELQEALSSLHESRVLSQSPVAISLGLDGHSLSQSIQNELKAEWPIPPLTARDCQVLRVTYFAHRLSAAQCAEHLHISRATYYRYLNKALTHLGQRLQQAVN